MSKLYENESLESLLSGQSKPRNQCHSSRRISFVITTVNLFILTITLFVSFIYRRESIEPLSSPDWKSCGDTSAQAIENGCIFDSMLSAWLHPDCFWAEHYSSASQTANITFFLDAALTEPYGPNKGGWPQKYLYAENDYHIMHCTYMWERQIMIWSAGSKIDSLSWDPHHTAHCIEMVLGKGNVPEGQIAKLIEGFPDCGMPSWEEIEEQRR